MEAAKKAALQAEEARKTAEAAKCRHESQVESVSRAVAPVFTVLLKDTVLKEGSSCELRARVSGIPAPQITWFKDGVPIKKHNSDYKTAFDAESGFCSLAIDETFAEDSANWSVRASNSAGYAESHAKLTVREDSPKKKPVDDVQSAPAIVLHLKDARVEEKSCVELRCRVTGLPVPEVSWFKNGICIDRSRTFILGERDGDHVLRIDRAEQDDSGDFSLKAINALGSVTSSARLQVAAAAPKAQLPEFEEPLSNAEVTAGQPLRLECQVRATPAPEIQWWHNGRRLNAAAADISYDGARATFVVQAAKVKSSGQYVCKARNAAGEATSTCTVEVLPEDFGQSGESSKRASQQFYKPAFYVPLRNQEAVEGEEVSLECVIIGDPEPEVIWYRNNVPVKESARLQLLFHGDSCKLILKTVEESDGGEFKVRAVNSAGECQSTCALNIAKSAPAHSRKAISTQTSVQETHTYFHSLNKGKPPKFVVPLQGKAIEDGTTNVILEGIIDAVPEPVITWFFNGKPLNAGSSATYANRRATLMFKKVIIKSRLAE